MKYTQLTEGERYQIYGLLKEGFSQKAIARNLERHPSTISRELKRNKGLKGYRHQQANRFAVERRCTAKKHIKLSTEVQNWIRTLIEQDLSPEQVCAYLERHRGLKLHHETVYQFIYRDKSLGGELHQHLRIANKPYRKRYGKYDRRGQIVNRVSIDERPKIVDEKSRTGDWEGDTIIGKGHKGALLTLVERKTLYTVIVPLKGKNAEQLRQAAIDVLTPFKERVLTVTFDNGKEFAEHEKMAEALEADIYFAHPYASWKRGINENTNGLIRQYFPKGTDLRDVTIEQAQMVMDRLNNRPRKTRGGKTPNELFMGLQVDLLAA
jgi:IS30 family transposase